MTEPTQEITLEEVRTRFLEAESRLNEAADAIAAIEQAAERMGVAHEGVVAAGGQLAGLASSMGDVATSLNDNATHLREGVDAIRAGDPAEIKRRIEELDAAFTAMQSVTVDWFNKLEAGIGENKASLMSLQRESRLIAVALAVLILASIILAVAR